ncbi:MAG: adenosylcobinamide amidohydrolase [Phyllobacteriaceae bacterium]|nr:adenosylcobinamide amidohydrolase [Phyllobacteriaceae bacterium]
MTTEPPDLTVRCRRPILAVRFREPQRLLSWSISHPGFVEADAVAWLEVRDADLPIGVDPRALLREKLAAAGLARAVGLMTACDVRSRRTLAVTVEDVTATVVTTVGLGNGEFVGRRRHAVEPWAPSPPETINTLVHVSRQLRDEALIETIAIAAQARTLAVLEATLRRGGDVLTGTGSDCIVVASPRGDGLPHAGLHTAVGEAVGAAVLEATRGAAACWLMEARKALHARRGGDAETKARSDLADLPS